MSRIEARFAQLRADGRKGFIPFVTAGDPDVEMSVAIVGRLAELGADLIELGVPFSDPMADGPTIQRSSQRALANGTDLRAVLDIARRTREKSDTPIVLFSYLNPLLRYGFDRLASDAADAGIDGVLITDVVDEEAAEFASKLRSHDLDLISLIAPTTSNERLARIAAASSGFLYAIARAGVTGVAAEMGGEAEKLVRRARSCSDLPIAVGFGVSMRAHVEDVWRYADAAVVGSAIVSEIEKAGGAAAVDRVETFVKGLLPQFAK
ncbi:MAG TPA: tryptophan synthase subunit alpha [Pyrinomonadaceae bacterium]|nr:tryptophan synthase subunit alpha [Pyrinomonadaceae bacterium]